MVDEVQPPTLREFYRTIKERWFIAMASGIGVLAWATGVIFPKIGAVQIILIAAMTAVILSAYHIWAQERAKLVAALGRIAKAEAPDVAALYEANTRLQNTVAADHDRIQKLSDEFQQLREETKERVDVYRGVARLNVRLNPSLLNKTLLFMAELDREVLHSSDIIPANMLKLDESMYEYWENLGSHRPGVAMMLRQRESARHHAVEVQYDALYAAKKFNDRAKLLADELEAAGINAAELREATWDEAAPIVVRWHIHNKLFPALKLIMERLGLVVGDA